MRSLKSFYLKALVVALTACGACGPAVAQINPPPQADSVSDTGVSYVDGSYNYDAGNDLSIGGEFPSGLTLHRSYSSGNNAFFAQGFVTPGWSANLLSVVNNSFVESLFQPPPGSPPPAQKILYSVVAGGARVGFYTSNGIAGPYTPVEPGPEKLQFSSSNQQTGFFTFTGRDGTTVTFYPGSWLADTLTAPDGTTLKYSYYGANLTGVFSNRGYAILFELGASGYTKACAVNLSTTYVVPGSPCPAGAQTVQYSFTTSPVSGSPLLAQFTDASGAVTTYNYVGYDHLGCIIAPGASSCKVTNTYGVCHRKQGLTEDPPYMHLSDPVLNQTLADGRTFSYSFSPTPECPRSSYSGSDITRTSNTGGTYRVTAGPPRLPASLTDELGRQTTSTYRVYNLLYAKPWVVTDAEGGQTELAYTNGLLTTKTQHAKPSTGLPDLVTTAVYPTTCSPATCAKPLSVTDPKGGTTTFTYDLAHGGVLTETSPAVAVNGVGTSVAAVKRYAYVQRSAWLKNSGGGYGQAASPIWLLSEMRTCRTTATIGNACAGGATDEVVTAYDYGPDSGPNTLLLRGTMVTAADTDGVIKSLRTCYRYDAQGNKISETKPRAGLTACP